MKKFPLVLIFLSAVIFARALELKDLKNAIPLNPVFKDAQYSVYAKYVGGPVIAEINPDYRLSPASILKLYTTAAALDILGPDYKFKTELYTSGVKKKKKLYGNLYIKGGGDPTLGSIRIPGAPGLEELTDNWVSHIKSMDIDVIEGGVYADNSIYSGIMLPWRTSYQNIGNYFAAPVDGLSVRDNSYDIYFEPCREEGLKAKILRMDPEIKGLELITDVTSYNEPSETIYVNFLPGRNAARVHGSITTSQKPMEVSAAMPRPALFLAEYLKSKLEAEGIKVKGEAQVLPPMDYKDKKLIFTQESPSLADIVKYTNKRSFNLYADMLLRAVSAHEGGPGTTGDGIAKIKEYLKRLGVEAANYEVFDGSGLSRDNILSCRTTVDMLEAVLQQPYSGVFLDSLPVAGDPADMGNMSRRLRRSTAAYNARVKTGSLDRARAHAGYIKDFNGKEIAFCIISNNFKGALWEANEMHESIINALSDIGLNKKPAAKNVKKL